MLFLILAGVINIISLIKFVGAEENTTDLFARFKIHFHKEYNGPESEEEAYTNFVNNLEVVNDLNKKHPGDVIAYQLNRYADLSPVEINNRYSLDIVPYEHIEKEETHQGELPHKLIEDINLYDLNDADYLYEKYVQKWKKKDRIDKSKSISHYYRFVKSVAEVNEKRFAGEDVTLGPEADELKEPNEYFYG